MKKKYLKPEVSNILTNVKLPLLQGSGGDGSSTEPLSEDEEGFGVLTYIKQSDSQFTTHNA